MKYIIEIKPEYEDSFKGVMILGVKDSNLFMDALAVDAIEELNSDYINEHFGSLQDDAYKRGLEEGKKAFDLLESEHNSEYQRGLDDAWEAATRIVCDETLGMSTLLHIFNRGTLERIFKDIPPAKAIEKLKAYEEKQKADDGIDEEITGFLERNNYTVDEVFNRLKRMKGEE